MLGLYKAEQGQSSSVGGRGQPRSLGRAGGAAGLMPQTASPSSPGSLALAVSRPGDGDGAVTPGLGRGQMPSHMHPWAIWTSKTATLESDLCTEGREVTRCSRGTASVPQEAHCSS